MKTRNVTTALVFIPLMVISLMTISCASTSKASEEKSTDAKQFETHPEKGVVYVYRPGRAVGAAAQSQIKINGLDAGGTGPGTFFRWELTPGTYTFSAFTTESSAVIEVDVKANEHYFIRQDERMGLSAGRVTMVIQDEATGMAGINKCKLLVSTYRQ
ncbi:MAG: hypothetical protein DRJ07_21105 [Bacteroidetes bacterium]|nr:MAG: hypothetical protein DRJ07_21105 [Bacteroidota bacterium]